MMKNKKIKPVLKNTLIFLFTSLFLCISILISIFYYITKDVSLDKAKLYDGITKTIVTYYDQNGNELKTDRSYISIDELKDYTKNAFIAKEDRRFYKHKGFDIIRIFGALKNNITSGFKKEGASTISQQLVKNTQLSTEKTLNRKIKEIHLAVQLENSYTKDEILEMYLNSIYFGNSCYGIESASNYYFDKSASSLTISESALLAGIISAPSEYNPIKNMDKAIENKNLVLKAMLDEQYISEEEYINAQNEDIILFDNDNNLATNNYLKLAKKEAFDILNKNDFSNYNKIDIFVNIDLDLQKNIENELKNDVYNIKNAENVVPDSGYIVIDNSGKIIAFGGNTNEDLYSLKRQPASTIKPILVYAPAFDSGKYSPATPILDEEIDIDGYSPKNASYGFTGWTNCRESLVKSLNIPSIKIIEDIGIDYAMNYAEKFGLTFNQNDRNLAIALGGLTDGITLKQLADAYSVFARYGTIINSSMIDKIIVDGSVIFKNEYEEEQVIDETTSYLITDILKEVPKKGTAKKLSNISFDIATKTGTSEATNNKNNDAWNVTYTMDHTIVSWFGNTSGNIGLIDESVNGSTCPTILVESILNFLYLDYTPNDFYIPDSITKIKLDKSIYDSEHKLATPSQDIPDRYCFYDIFNEKYKPQNINNIKKIDDNFELNIWVELDDYPIINFNGDIGKKYEIYRKTTEKSENFDNNISIFAKIVDSFLGRNESKNSINEIKTELIYSCNGTGKKISFIDKNAYSGKLEYYVLCYYDDKTIKSNSVKVMI